MNPVRKQVIAIAQSSTTNAATATGQIDTLGYDHCEIDVIMATSDAVTNNPTVFKISESDTTDATNYSDVSGLVGDTDWTIPDAVTSGDWGVKFSIDCRPRKRYLKLSISPLTTQVITAIANLHKGDEGPDSSTDANVKALVEL